MYTYKQKHAHTLFSFLKMTIMTSLICVEKLGNSSILSPRCRSNITVIFAIVDLTRPAAFASEAERCVIITC